MLTANRWTILSLNGDCSLRKKSVLLAEFIKQYGEYAEWEEWVGYLQDGQNRTNLNGHGRLSSGVLLENVTRISLYAV